MALQTSCEQLVDAFGRFFKKQNRYPRFKSKKNPVQSYTIKNTNHNIATIGNKIKLPKLGLVKFKQTRAQQKLSRRYEQAKKDKRDVRDCMNYQKNAEKWRFSGKIFYTSSQQR